MNVTKLNVWESSPKYEDFFTTRQFVICVNRYTLVLPYIPYFDMVGLMQILLSTLPAYIFLYTDVFLVKILNTRSLVADSINKSCVIANNK